jgi:hypothetical protein
MTRATRVRVILGLVITSTLLLVALRGAQDWIFAPSASPLPTTTSPLPLPVVAALDSPLPVPPTAPPPINAATLEAIRTTRPTATPPSPSGFRLPYVSPETWRAWALRILAAAGLLAYIGLRLRRSQ